MQLPLLFCCTTVLELSLQCTGFYSSKLWLLSTPRYSLLKLHTSFQACGIIAYYVVYDKVEWTVAVVTTSDVFLFSCSVGHLAVVRLLLEEFKVNPECASNIGWTPLHHACMYVPGADY